MGLRTDTTPRKTKLCTQCFHEIVLLNNDEEFSMDMHVQEDHHINSKRGKITLNKTENVNNLQTVMKEKEMLTWFSSKDIIEERALTLESLSQQQLNNKERNEKVIKDVKSAFSKVYKYNFTVLPFGSRLTGLTTKETGDLDLFIDTSDCGNEEVSLIDCLELGKKYLRKLADHMKSENNTWVNVVDILSCRTPILKVTHFDTKMSCDITVTNSFGNVNSQLMSVYMKNIPDLRKMILMIREWAVKCDLVRDHNNMNNYTLSMMVLFYFQQKKLAPAVYDFEFCYSKPRKIINGYECIDYDEITYDWNIKRNKNIPFHELLHGFYSYYENFDFETDIVCPLLGKPIKKILFDSKGKKLPPELEQYKNKVKNRGENFKINDKSMNVQDPIDLSHNLTKSTREEFLYEFIELCMESSKALEKIN